MSLQALPIAEVSVVLGMHAEAPPEPPELLPPELLPPLLEPPELPPPALDPPALLPPELPVSVPAAPPFSLLVLPPAPAPALPPELPVSVPAEPAVALLVSPVAFTCPLPLQPAAMAAASVIPKVQLARILASSKESRLKRIFYSAGTYSATRRGKR